MTYLACWAGAVFEAAPQLGEGGLWMRLRSTSPADGFERLEDGLYVHAVPAAECAWVRHVITVCMWRGAPFLVCAEREDELLVEYVGAHVTVARELDLDRIDRGVHRLWVRRAEVSELQELAVEIDNK
ncbi:hypothetical protein [Nonomuraea sp. NPDC005501]|uniref:hypothetical protein n=1 Tax=Nonomuraea sp. NPDC005501 TaxID=3156884 RepID=UPI0033A8E36D